MQTNAYSMGRTEWIMLLSLSLLWGFSFINIKNSLTEIPPFSLVFIRLWIAFSALYLWCIISKKSLKLSFKEHFLLSIGGLIGCAIPFCLYTWGQQYVATSIGAIFNATVPFFTALLAHVFIGGRETMTTRKAIGLSIGMLGMIFVMGIDQLSAFNPSNLGQLAIIGACLFYSCSGIYYQKFIPGKIDKSVATAYTLFWAAIAMSIVSISIDGWPSFDYSANVWFSVSILGLFSTALAYIILFRLLQRAGPSNTSLNTFLIPVVGIAVGVILLDETLDSTDLIGVAFIFIGVAIIQNFGKLIIRLFRKNSKRLN